MENIFESTNKMESVMMVGNIKYQKKRIDDVFIAKRAFLEIKDKIIEGKFVHKEVERTYLGSVENFLLAFQTLTSVCDKISGEFKNYILGEYKKGDKAIEQAIEDAHKIEALLDKALVDHSYELLYEVGKAKQQGISVWNKKLVTNKVLSYKEMMDFYDQYCKVDPFKQFNSEVEQVKPHFKMVAGNQYELSFIMVGQHISTIDKMKKVRKVIGSKFPALKTNKLELENVLFEDLIVTYMYEDITHLVPKGIVDRFSNKKRKKVSYLLGFSEEEKKGSNIASS